MAEGFPTTLAVTNHDGWAYAILVDWLKDHPFPRDVAPTLAEPRTFVPWNTGHFDFGVGFEHVAAMLANLLGRQGFEVVNPAAAVGLAAAVGGWAALAKALRPRVATAATALVAVAVASPVLVLAFAENYTTQFVSMCLWPFALAAFALFAAQPGWRRLVVAALASGSLLGVYPAALPWLVLPIAAIALVLVPSASDALRPPLARLAGPGIARRAGRAAAVIAGFAAAVLILSPIQVVRGAQNLLYLDDTPVQVGSAFYSEQAYASLFLGTTPFVDLFTRSSIGWLGLTALVAVAIACVIALVPRGRLDARRATALGIAAGVLVTTGAILIRYRIVDELPYQLYKGLLSGGAVLAGLLVIGLLPGRASRGRVLRLIALGCVAVVWIAVSSQNLRATVPPERPGFRKVDVEMGAALAALPPGSTVLVEGAGEDDRSFQYRMMAIYFGDRGPGLTAVGLGTTASYLTVGGQPEWRPSRPWTDVLQSRPQPVATDRRPLWANSAYSLWTAPSLDLTTYGPGWHPPIAAGGSVYAQTRGPAEVVVSNGTAQPRRARVHMSVTSYARPRVVTLAADGRAVRRRLQMRVPETVAITLLLPPESTTPVTLTAAPATPARRPGDRRPAVLRVEELDVTEVAG